MVRPAWPPAAQRWVGQRFERDERGLSQIDFVGQRVNIRFGARARHEDRSLGTHRQHAPPLGCGRLGDQRLPVIRLIDRKLVWEFGFQRGNLCPQLGPPRFVGRVDERVLRFVGVVQEGKQAVVIALRQRVVLVVVALGTSERQPHPDGRGRADPVDHGMEAKLERIDPALFVEHRVAVKSRGHDLIARRVGQHVARQLLDRKLVERQIAIQRRDHPVAIGPDDARFVFLVAIGVGIAGEVQPATCPAFSIVRRGQQPIDESLVSVRRRVVHEGVDLGNRRRQANEVQRQSADQRLATRFGARDESLGFQSGQNEAINRIPDPLFALHDRQRAILRRDQRPMRLVVGPCGDPSFQNQLVTLAERQLRFGRRHHLARIGGLNPRDQFARLGMTGNNRHLPRPCRADGSIPNIQPQTAAQGFVVGTMTLVAVLRQDRPHVASECDFYGSFGGGANRGPPTRQPGHSQQRRDHHRRRSTSAPPQTVRHEGQWPERALEVVGVHRGLIFEEQFRNADDKIGREIVFGTPVQKGFVNQLL